MHKIYCLAALLIASAGARAADRILIMTKTAAYRETNIAPARLALKKFLENKGLVVDTTENAGLFTDSSLAKYRTLVFLKTSGDMLNAGQQAAFEKFFKAGGGLVAIHAALDTEYDWAFYGKLLGGGYYKSLGGNQTTKHTIVVEDTNDLSTRKLPKRWERIDEIYNLKANPRLAKDPAVHVLVTVDESTYKSGVAGTDHPMSWYVAYQGGRAWVTAMGHTTASYSDSTGSGADSLFLDHVWGGMQYTLGLAPTALAFPGAGHSGGKAAAKRFSPGPTPRYGKDGDKDVRGRKARKANLPKP